MIAASKASTANGLSGNDYALSTANDFAAAQPGQSLYSLATSAAPNAEAVFGDPATFGTPNDPMVGKAIGGVIVFGGGLPLYTTVVMPADEEDPDRNSSEVQIFFDSLRLKR